MKGAVAPVMDQKNCGAGWAFAAVGSLEGRYAIKKGLLLQLSQQQLIDCAGGPYGNEGCKWGFVDAALTYARDYGMILLSDYNYFGYERDCCSYKVFKAIVKNKALQYVEPNNLKALKSAIAQGPVSVAIAAGSFEFRQYSGGIFNSELCGTRLNHGLVAVGYGYD